MLSPRSERGSQGFGHFENLLVEIYSPSLRTQCFPCAKNVPKNSNASDLLCVSWSRDPKISQSSLLAQMVGKPA